MIRALQEDSMMMTFRDKVNNIAKIKDFYTFAEALEEYAIDGIACRSPVLQEGAKRELMEKLKEHLLTEFGPLAYKPGSCNYFIRFYPLRRGCFASVYLQQAYGPELPGEC